jgi:hypothetical protein
VEVAVFWLLVQAVSPTTRQTLMARCFTPVRL